MYKEQMFLSHLDQICQRSVLVLANMISALNKLTITSDKSLEKAVEWRQKRKEMNPGKLHETLWQTESVCAFFSYMIVCLYTVVPWSKTEGVFSLVQGIQISCWHWHIGVSMKDWSEIVALRWHCFEIQQSQRLVINVVDLQKKRRHIWKHHNCRISNNVSAAEYSRRAGIVTVWSEKKIQKPCFSSPGDRS